jgi:hypothetical protein
VKEEEEETAMCVAAGDSQVCVCVLANSSITGCHPSRSSEVKSAPAEWPGLAALALFQFFDSSSGLVKYPVRFFLLSSPSEKEEEEEKTTTTEQYRSPFFGCCCAQKNL